MTTPKSLITFISCLILVSPAASQERGWRGIVPLHSTQEDVERLIGPPVKPGGITYDLKDERVNVTYSAVPCAQGWPYGWNVQSGTVTNITVFFKQDVRLADLRFDLSKFTKFINPNIRSDIHYTNNDEGFSITTADLDDQRGEKVISYEFFSAATDRHMMCPEAAAREQEIVSGHSAYVPPVLSYSEVSPQEERRHLESLVEQLRKYPLDSQIYIIGYGGRESCPNEGLLHADQAKDCLQKLGVSAQRIITIDGGHKAAVWNEMYIVRPGAPKPLSTPEIYPKDVRVTSNCSNIGNKFR